MRTFVFVLCAVMWLLVAFVIGTMMCVKMVREWESPKILDEWTMLGVYILALGFWYVILVAWVGQYIYRKIYRLLYGKITRYSKMKGYF